MGTDAALPFNPLVRDQFDHFQFHHSAVGAKGPTGIRLASLKSRNRMGSGTAPKFKLINLLSFRASRLINLILSSSENPS